MPVGEERRKWEEMRGEGGGRKKGEEEEKVEGLKERKTKELG